MYFRGSTQINLTLNHHLLLHYCRVHFHTCRSYTFTYMYISYTLHPLPHTHMLRIQCMSSHTLHTHTFHVHPTHTSHTIQDVASLARKSTHTVTINKGASNSAVTEYGHDPSTDLFQVSLCTAPDTMTQHVPCYGKISVHLKL